MHIEAVAFDLDDTLLRDDLSISDYTLSVLRRARARGVRVIPASGRTATSMRASLERIGEMDCFISCNGAQVYSPDGTLLHEVLLDVPLAREFAAFAAQRNCYAQTYVGDRFFYSLEGPIARRYASLSALQGEYVGDLVSFITQPTPKLLLIDTPERIAQLLAEAQERWGDRAALVCSKPHYLEVNPPGATKGLALRWCAEHFGFRMENTLAFGDSLNDLSMLHAAGRGIAMANAREDVRAQGFPLCDSNENDGVARYVDACLTGGIA